MSEEAHKKAEVTLNAEERVFVAPVRNMRWCWDSGCTFHVSENTNIFEIYDKLSLV